MAVQVGLRGCLRKGETYAANFGISMQLPGLALATTFCKSNPKKISEGMGFRVELFEAGSSLHVACSPQTVAFAFRMLVRVLGCASPGAKEGFQVSARMQLHVTHDSYVLRLSNRLGIKDMMHCLLARQSAEIPS